MKSFGIDASYSMISTLKEAGVVNRILLTSVRPIYNQTCIQLPSDRQKNSGHTCKTGCL